MPVLDDRYVRHLQDFTKALDGVVQLLVEDSKKKNVDSVDKMLTNMNEDLRSVVKNMEVVMKSTKKIETQNDKILEEIKASRKAKESGMFGDIADVDNKRKILDAVKVITLIAAGIIAIGLAFKLIAPVPVLSIIAIGLAIVFIAGAFVMVAAVTEGMDQKDVGRITGMMVTMSLALMVSSWILAFSATITLAKAMSILFVATSLGGALAVMAYAIEKSKIEPKDYPKFLLIPLVLPIIALGLTVSSIILSKMIPLTFMQMVTTVFVAAAIGTALFLITKALDKTSMEKKHVGQFLLLPIIVPALALGLVAASWILKGIMPLSFGQMVSAIFTAVTIGVLVYLMKPMIEKLKDLNLTQVILAGALIVALSAGLVAASWVLSGMRLMGWKESLLLVLNSLAIGLAILFLTPAVYILKSIEKKQMMQAAVNIVILSGAIAASSIILSLGVYTNAPSWRWAIGVGLSITTFAGAMWVLNKMNLSIKDVATGALAMIGISTVIMLTSVILGVGKYDKYPGLGWAIGVGLTLVTFGLGMMVLGAILSASGGTAAGALAIGALAVLGISAVIVTTSYILGIGKYEKYPTFDWATGVGLSLVAFGAGMMLLGGIILASGGLAAGAMMIGLLAVGFIATSIIGVAWILSKGNYDKHPTFGWAAGVGLSLVAFGVGMMLLGGLILSSGGLAAGALMVGILAVGVIGAAIVGIDYLLSRGKYEKYPTFDWAKGVGLSLVAFGFGMMLLGALIILSGGLAAGALIIGALASSFIAKKIVSVAEILAGGIYDYYPTFDWAKGVGLSLVAFGVGMILLGSLIILSGGLAAGALIIGAMATSYIAKKIVSVAEILGGGNYDKYPTVEWAKGTGLALLEFGGGMMLLGGLILATGGLAAGALVIGILAVGIIALAIVGASHILAAGNYDKYPSTDWSKGVGISLFAFGVSMMLLGGLILATGGLAAGALLVGILAVGIIALAIVGASYILAAGNYDKYPSNEWAKGVGLSLIAFGAGMMVLGGLILMTGGLAAGALLVGILAVGIIAVAIVGASYILGAGNYANYPSYEWSKGVGLSLLAFGAGMMVLGGLILATGGLAAGALLVGILAVGIISVAIVLVSAILAEGNYDTYPSYDWAKGVGLTITTFGLAMILMGPFVISLFFGAVSMWLIAKTIQKISHTIAEGDYEAPGLESWAKGISKVYLMFGAMAPLMPMMLFGAWGANIMSGLIVDTSNELAKGNYTKGPTGEWAEGIEKTIAAFVKSTLMLEMVGVNNFGLMARAGRSIVNFAESLIPMEKYKELFLKGGLFDTFSESMQRLSTSLTNGEQMAKGLDALGESFARISEMGMTSGDSIRNLTKSVIELSDSLKSVDMESIDKLSKFSNGILVLSLLDEKKLEEALSTINQKKNDIKAILSDNAGTIGRAESVAGATTLEEAQAAEAQAGAVDEQKKFYSDLLSYVQSLDANVGKILEKIPVDTGGGSNDTPVEKPVAGVGSQQTNPTK